MGRRRLKTIARVDSLTLCGIRPQGTIAWVLSAFRRKNNRTHRSKVTSPNERRGRKARGFERYSGASNPPDVTVINRKSGTRN